MSPRWTAVLALACGCAPVRSIASTASIDRSIAPSRLGADPQSVLVRVWLEPERASRWLAFDPSHPERVRAFALEGERPRVTASYARPLPDEGTFDVPAGFSFEGSLAVSERSAMVLARWTEAQGAVDPRTFSQSLLVLRVSADRIEPSLECQLAFSLTQGPDRATTDEQPERTYRVVDRTIVVRDGARESRATLEAGQWRLEGERWCAVLR